MYQEMFNLKQAETKNGWSLDLQNRTIIQNVHPNQHKNVFLPWLSQSPDLNLWAELKRSVHKRGPKTGEILSVKRNGLRFLSLYSTTLLDVMGEDFVQPPFAKYISK